MASRVVIITGAASGIGRALSGRLARRGDHLVLLDVNAVGLTSVSEELSPVASAAGGSVRTHVVDVRDADAVAGAVEHTWNEFGRVDVMVNNAGIGIGGPAEEMSAAHWQRVFDINISGVMHGVAAAYPRMVAAGSGSPGPDTPGAVAVAVAVAVASDAATSGPVVVGSVSQTSSG